MVDDEPHILAVLGTLLGDYQVSTARSGREAIALIEEREFDVIGFNPFD